MKAYERFLEYVKYHTTSSESSGTTPSSKGQLVLAQKLCCDLKAIGVEAEVDEFGYVYASLKANTDKPANTIGFIAHMDTSPDADGKDVKARIVEYGGGDILLNEEKNIYLSVSEYPYLASYEGKKLIVTDGTTLLGADDKAGVSEIISAIERLIVENIPHGDIKIAFTPDEEIGEGTDHFDVEKFGVDYAYTVDGGALGELEYENFNAATAVVKVNGRSIHPGSAKDKMKNAARIACEFDSYLPQRQLPENTEGYDGFHHLISMKGECESAELVYIIRDHNKDLFEIKKKDFSKVEELFNYRYGDGTVQVEINDSYYNMREKVEENMFIVQRAERAMLAMGVTPRVMPIRGGTDGARLSFMGVPCPNICTGGENFHSRFEFACVESMDKITDILVRIAEDAIELGKEEVKI